MPPRPDYYAILQVHPNAEKEVIDAAYRKLALKYHPDVNPATEAPQRMKEIIAAYQVLSNPAKRASYDQSRRRTSEPPAGARTEATPHDTVTSTPAKHTRENLPTWPQSWLLRGLLHRALAFGAVVSMIVYGVSYGSENAVLVGLFLFMLLIPLWMVEWWHR